MSEQRLILPTRIETERLYLRPYQAGDGAMYFGISQKNRAHLARYESGNVLMRLQSEDEAEVIVRELGQDWAEGNCFFVGVFEKKSGEFAAQVYVGPIDLEVPEYIIGYIADCDHEGQGYVTEAVGAVLKAVFLHLEAHSVTIRTDGTNLRSQRVAERCGFTREGCIRQDKVNPDGSYSDTLLYGLLQTDFLHNLR
jgi:aminoglycoside 6'-N-acetyltransferase